MFFLPFSEIIHIGGSWPLSFAWKDLSLPLAILGTRVWPTGHWGLLLGQEKYPVSRVESSLVCLRVHKDREPGTLQEGLWSQQNTAVPGPALAATWFWFSGIFYLDLPLFFVVLLVPALCTCSLTSVSLTCLSIFGDDLSLDSHCDPLLPLTSQEASLILVCSHILDPKCWHECTSTDDASHWPTSLDLGTERNWKFQWTLETLWKISTVLVFRGL